MKIKHIKCDKCIRDWDSNTGAIIYGPTDQKHRVRMYRLCHECFLDIRKSLFIKDIELEIK